MLWIWTLAEPIALGTAISNGEREKMSIVAVGVDGDSYPIMSPCGNCRQLLLDYAPDCMVIIANGSKIVKIRARDLPIVHWRIFEYLNYNDPWGMDRSH